MGLFSSSIFAASFPVKSISLAGNEKTKDFVILREMLVAVDSIYPETGEGNITELVRISKDRIINLNLFNTCDIHVKLQETRDGYGFVLDVELVEKWYIWPMPFVEFSDRNFNVWGGLDFDPARTNYGLNVFNYNLFGRNHTFKTRMKTGYNTKFGVEYRVPFLGRNTDWGMRGEIDYSNQNEVWLFTKNDSLQFYENGRTRLVANTQANVELSKRVTPFTRVYYGLLFQHEQLDSSVPSQGFYLNDARYQRNYAAYVKIENDKRDNIYYPLKGSYLTGRLETQLWQNTNRANNIMAQVKVQKFDQWTNRLYSAISLFGEYNTRSRVPYSERRLLGYNEVVRGYEHYVIDGTFGLKATAAVRYQCFKKEMNLAFIPAENYKLVPVSMYAEIYTDAGYAGYGEVEASNRLPNGALYSVGIGLNTLLFNDRLLRLEYSLNGLKEGGFFVHFKKAI